MKNKINYILALFIVTFALSCDNDDDDAINITEKIVSATITTNALSAEEDNLYFVVNLAEALPSDFDMRVLVTMDDSRTKSTQVLIPAGSTSVSSSLFLPSADDFSVGYNGLNNGANIQVIGGILSEPIVGTQYIVTSEKVFLTIFDRVASVDPDSLVILFDWDNALTSDIDLQIDGGIALSNTGSRYELVNLLNTEADGTYTVSISVWSTSDTDEVPYKFFVRFPNGDQQLFEGEFDSLSDGDTSTMLTIIKTGDNYVVTEN